MFGIHSSKNFSRAVCCLPLALVGIVISLVYVVWGSLEIATLSIAIQNGTVTAGNVIALIVGILRTIGGLLGVVAVVRQKEGGFGILVMFNKIILIGMIIAFIAQWIDWTVQLIGVNGNSPWHPTTEDIVYMSLFTVLCIAYFILFWWILSVFKSIRFVFKAGGTGWEYKSQKELKEERSRDRQAALRGEDAL
eukprot:Lankesteria_metandrocarpae@DN1851_c1_g1_i1.p1